MAMIRVYPDVNELAAILMPDGPDSETGLVVRKEIMNQFAGAYLKRIINDPQFSADLKKTAEALNQEATSVVRAEFMERMAGEWRLREIVRQQIQGAVRDSFHTVVRDVIAEQVTPGTKRAEEAIAARFETAIKYWTDRISAESSAMRDAEAKYIAAAAKLEAAAESLTADHLEPMVTKAIKAYMDAKFGG